MPAGSEGVWVVCDPSGKMLGASAKAYEEGGAEAALNERVLIVGENGFPAFEGVSIYRQLSAAVHADGGRRGHYEVRGYTLQRLPLATPAMVRVMEAARTMLGARTVAEKGQASLTLRDALSAFDHAGAAVVKKSLTTDAARAAGGKDG